MFFCYTEKLSKPISLGISVVGPNSLTTTHTTMLHSARTNQPYHYKYTPSQKYMTNIEINILSVCYHNELHYALVLVVLGFLGHDNFRVGIGPLGFFIHKHKFFFEFKHSVPLY